MNDLEGFVVLNGAFPTVDLTETPDGVRSTVSGIMYFHAYCTGAIAKHMADRGLPAPEEEDSEL